MASEAPTCRAGLTEATKRWPKRDKESDGIMSSDYHKKQNPTSDHDFGNAWDLTNDPDAGLDVHAYADWLVARRDPRIKYIISRRRIWSAARANLGWRKYSGSNPHVKHIHISVYSASRGSKLPWFAGYPSPKPIVPQPVIEEDEMKSFIAIDAKTLNQYAVAGDWARKVWLRDGHDPAALAALGYESVTLSSETLQAIPNAGT